MIYFLAYALIGCIVDYIVPRTDYGKRQKRISYHIVFTGIIILIWPLFFYFLVKRFLQRRR